MKRLAKDYVATLSPAVRLYILAYALGYPLALLGAVTHSFDLRSWMDMSPPLVLHGEAWRLFSYSFIGAGPIDWAVSLFWLLTLVPVVTRSWRGGWFWIYCLVCAAGGALPILLLMPRWQVGFVGNAAVAFGLLVVWDRFYRYERLLLLGIGELSVRQAALLIALINTLILFFCAGWRITLFMLCGGVAGWLFLLIPGKALLAKSAVPARSERIARLEL